jgi:hypothetical protein
MLASPLTVSSVGALGKTDHCYWNADYLNFKPLLVHNDSLNGPIRFIHRRSV